MYAMNIQNDVIGLVLQENCKSKQVTDFIAWASRCHVRIYKQTTHYYASATHLNASIFNFCVHKILVYLLENLMKQ
jgi:hypothetical protein